MLDRPALETLATVDDVTNLALSDSGLATEAIMLIGFQRTKQIGRKARLAWMNGDPAPMRAEAEARRREIFDGALLEIYQEYVPLRDQLASLKVVPKRVIDIGCGQAINDLFLHQDFQPHFTLVDIEHTPDQYHQFSSQGSGYASLDNAKTLLLANGVAEKDLAAINPRKTPEALEGLTGDLVTSLYSCGFHYPVDEYVPLFDRVIEAGGAVCLDLRNNYTANQPDSAARLLDGRAITTVYEDTKSKRVLVRKD